MPAMDDDDRPKKKLVHEIGQDLSLLSVEELGERVQLLRDEIGAPGSRHGAKARQTRAPPISFSSDNRRFAAPRRAKIAHWAQFGNVSLSFLDHYCDCPSSWTLSGSCPLCLTPPCYQLRAAGDGGSFLSHFGTTRGRYGLPLP